MFIASTAINIFWRNISKVHVYQQSAIFDIEFVNRAKIQKKKKKKKKRKKDIRTFEKNVKLNLLHKIQNNVSVSTKKIGMVSDSYLLDSADFFASS